MSKRKLAMVMLFMFAVATLYVLAGINVSLCAARGVEQAAMQEFAAGMVTLFALEIVLVGIAKLTERIIP